MAKFNAEWLGCILVSAQQFRSQNRSARNNSCCHNTTSLPPNTRAEEGQIDSHPIVSPKSTPMPATPPKQSGATLLTPDEPFSPSASNGKDSPYSLIFEDAVSEHHDGNDDEHQQQHATTSYMEDQLKDFTQTLDVFRAQDDGWTSSDDGNDALDATVGPVNLPHDMATPMSVHTLGFKLTIPERDDPMVESLVERVLRNQASMMGGDDSMAEAWRSSSSNGIIDGKCSSQPSLLDMGTTTLTVPSAVWSKKEYANPFESEAPPKEDDASFGTTDVTATETCSTDHADKGVEADLIVSGPSAASSSSSSSSNGDDSSFTPPPTTRPRRLLSGMRQLPTRKNYKAKPSVSPPPPEKPKPAPKAAPKRKRGGGTATRSVKTKAKRRKISAKRDPETESAEALAQLDDWQTTFVRFLTLPSQHVYEKTGDPVPLRSVATWGRQKVKWSTANARTGTTQVPADKGGNVVSHKLFEEAKSKTSTRRSSQGGTNSSLVPSATLGSSDNKPRAMIRMSEAEALRFHDEEHNHDFGEWISKERKLFVERQISPKAPPLFPKKRHDESKEESVSLVMTKDAPKPEREDIDLRFAHVQQSFRFNLLRMCGVDLERIDSRDTMIQRKVNDPSRKHPKNKKNALPALFDLDVMDDSEFQLDANFMEM